MVKFLLDNGAKPDVVDKYRRTALDYAREVGHPQIIMMLEAKLTSAAIRNDDSRGRLDRKNSFK